MPQSKLKIGFIVILISVVIPFGYVEGSLEELTVVHHEGDYIVHENQVRTIENMHLIIQGSIILNENSVLNVNNSLIEIEYREFEDWARVSEGGVLNISNSVLQGPSNTRTNLYSNGIVEFHESNSNLYFHVHKPGKLIVENSQLQMTYWFHETQLEIVNSTVHEITIIFSDMNPVKDYQLNELIADNKYSRNWTRTPIDTLLVENSTIETWIIGIDHGFKGTLSISDAKLRNMWIQVDQDVSLSNWKNHDIFSNWQLQEYVSGDLFFDVFMDKCTSDVFSLVLTRDVLIKNSSGHIGIGRVGHGLPSDEFQTLKFDNSNLDSREIELVQNLIIKGNVSIRTEQNHIVLNDFYCIREYPIQVLNAENNPAQGVKIQIKDERGIKIGEEIPDSNGYAFFNITFTKENIDESWAFQTLHEQQEFETEVNFRSETPIIIDAKVCELRINTEYGTSQNEGFYKIDTPVELSITPIVTISEKSRAVFNGWSSEQIGGYTGPNIIETIKLRNDITQTATWKTQYYISLESGQGGIISPESGWYDEGTQLTITAVPEAGSEFDSWMGGENSYYSGPASSFQFTVNQPIQAAASFQIVDQKPIVEITNGPMRTETDRKQIFEWTASDDISNTDSLVYQYKLEGYDDGWSAWTPQTSKTYEYIVPGDYTFSVRARDESDVISEVKERVFTISSVSTIQIGDVIIPADSFGFSLTVITLGLTIIGVVRSFYIEYLKRKRSQELFQLRMAEIIKSKKELTSLEELSDTITSDHFINQLLNKTQFEELYTKIEDYIEKIKEE